MSHGYRPYYPNPAAARRLRWTLGGFAAIAVLCFGVLAWTAPALHAQDAPHGLADQSQPVMGILETFQNADAVGRTPAMALTRFEAQTVGACYDAARTLAFLKQHAMVACIPKTGPVTGLSCVPGACVALDPALSPILKPFH